MENHPIDGQDFRRARARSFLRGMWGLLSGKNTQLMAWDDVRDKLGLRGLIRRGVQPVPVAKIDPALEHDQVRRLQALRARRSAAEHARALQALDDAAVGTGNLVAPIVGAVKAYATVGEIADVLRARFGEYVPAR